MHRVRIAAVSLAVIALVAGARAQTHSPSVAKHPSATAAPAAHVIVPASDVKWGPAPNAFPSGAQMALIQGDPSKAGAPFVVRLKMPDGYVIGPHWHPTDEAVTVLNGDLQAAMGDTFDASALKDLAAGSFALMPTKMTHYVRAKGETIVQVHAMGPFAMTYVNAKDDPRKKSTN